MAKDKDGSPTSIGERVRDAKWGGAYTGTVTRRFASGDVAIRWDGGFAEDQLGADEYVVLPKK